MVQSTANFEGTLKFKVAKAQMKKKKLSVKTQKWSMDSEAR